MQMSDVGTHSIALFCNRNEIVYFDSFGVEHIPEEIKEFVGNKKIKDDIFRVQANDSVMCGYFCMGFIDFMSAGRKLNYYTIFFLHMILRKTIIQFCHISVMNKSNSIEAIDKTNLTNQTKFRLDEISKIENYFVKEINQRKSGSKTFSKSVFGCIDQIRGTSGRVLIILFTSIAGAPVGIASAILTLFFL